MILYDETSGLFLIWTIRQGAALLGLLLLPISVLAVLLLPVLVARRGVVLVLLLPLLDLLSVL